MVLTDLKVKSNILLFVGVAKLWPFTSTLTADNYINESCLGMETKGNLPNGAPILCWALSMPTTFTLHNAIISTPLYKYTKRKVNLCVSSCQWHPRLPDPFLTRSLGAGLGARAPGPCSGSFSRLSSVASFPDP